jgi:hypothetical protein
MQEILTIFLILLVLLLIISTLGGSIRFNEPFQEQSQAPMYSNPEAVKQMEKMMDVMMQQQSDKAYSPPSDAIHDMPPPVPSPKIEDTLPKLPGTLPPIDPSTEPSTNIEPFEDGFVGFASVSSQH